MSRSSGEQSFGAAPLVVMRRYVSQSMLLAAMLLMMSAACATRTVSFDKPLSGPMNAEQRHDLFNRVWSYVADPTVYTFVLGEPTRMEDGSTFVNWSAAGQLERVTPDGERIWKLNTGARYVFGFHTQEKSLYPRELRTP